MAPIRSPRVFVLAGPNGAGKSTAAPVLFGERVTTERMINPDVIARALRPDAPDMAARAAARQALKLRRHLLRQREDFAYETTLSGHVRRDFEQIAAHGFEIDLWYLFLADPRDCLARVRQRVAEGGHGVPDDDVVRRHRRGLVNFDTVGRTEATRWRLIDAWTTEVIATGVQSTVQVVNAALFTEYENAVRQASKPGNERNEEFGGSGDK